MTGSLKVTDAVRNFSEYLNRVAYRRESFVLLRGGRPVAELRPVPEGRCLGDLPALLSSGPRVADADSFAADLETARGRLGTEEWVDPWES